MRKGWLILYGILMIAMSTVLVAYLSVLLAMQGVSLPWILALPNGYAVKNALVLIPGILLGGMIAWMSHSLAVKKNNAFFYYAGPITIIIVIAAVALALYGGACGYCKAVVCSPKPVSECGIKTKLSITLFEIYCKCSTGSLPMWQALGL